MHGTIVAMPPSGAQFIFTMRKCSRFHPPDREVLKDITLAFYPGAKIGVLGPNGAGKSTLLRIMAGVDDGYTGEARLTPGFTVGLLEQEPQLDPAKDVIGNVMDGVGETARLLDRVRRGAGRLGRPRRRLREARRARRPTSRSKIEAAGAWDLEAHRRDRHGRAAAAARRRRRRHPLRRRAAPGRAVPPAAVAARPAAARRAHQPPRRRVGGLARAVPARLPGHGRRHHPRPLLPRQRGRLDPRAGPRPGHALRGQLLVLARAEAGPAGPGGEAGLGPPAHPRARARVGAAWPRRPARPRARPASPRYEKLLAEAKAAEGRASRPRDRHPARAPGWATR